MEIAPLERGELDEFVDELWLPAQRDMAAVTPYELADDIRGDGLADRRERLAAEECVTYVGRERGDPVGYVSAAVQTPPPTFAPVRECHVSEVYVVPGMRRKGAATALLETAEEWGRAYDCERMDLNVDAVNDAALGAYERLGYEVARHNMKKPLGDGA